MTRRMASAKCTEASGNGKRVDTGLLVCCFLTEAAKSWQQCNNVRQATAALDEAFEFAGSTCDRYYLAEMYGFAEKSSGAAASSPKPSLTFPRPFGSPREQSARTFELRAATSLLALTRSRTDLKPRKHQRQIAERETFLRELLSGFAADHDCSDVRAACILIAAKGDSTAGRARRPPKRKRPDT